MGDALKQCLAIEGLYLGPKGRALVQTPTLSVESQTGRARQGGGWTNVCLCSILQTGCNAC